MNDTLLESRDMAEVFKLGWGHTGLELDQMQLFVSS